MGSRHWKDITYGKALTLHMANFALIPSTAPYVVSQALQDYRARRKP